jgi:hypothetical protein
LKTRVRPTLIAIHRQMGTAFRCGTCREYPLYDLTERRLLHLRECPLILMECSVIAERYLSLGYSEAALAMMWAIEIPAGASAATSPCCGTIRTSATRLIGGFTKRSSPEAS